MVLRPVQIFLTRDGQLGIDWNDGLRTLYTASQLRMNCPCAMCTSPEYRPAESQARQADPELAITTVDPVGSYGYKIRFSDGHDTGIFTIELLRQLNAPQTP